MKKYPGLRWRIDGLLRHPAIAVEMDEQVDPAGSLPFFREVKPALNFRRQINDNAGVRYGVERDPLVRPCKVDHRRWVLGPHNRRGFPPEAGR